MASENTNKQTISAALVIMQNSNTRIWQILTIYYQTFTAFWPPNKLCVRAKKENVELNPALGCTHAVEKGVKFVLCSGLNEYYKQIVLKSFV